MSALTANGAGPHAQTTFIWDRTGLQRVSAAGTGLIGTTALTTAITIGRVGIVTTIAGDLTVDGALIVVGAETFTGLVTITSTAGAGAAGALGPEELQIETTQAATAGATIRNPGYIDWEARCWETTGGTSTVQLFGRFGAVVDTITAATGVPATYRMVWTNTAGVIQWAVDQAGNVVQLGTLSTTAIDINGGDLTELDEASFSDAVADATAAGRLRRNGINLTWHDGTAARPLVWTTGAQTLDAKTLTGVVSAAFAAGGDITGLDEIEFTDAAAGATAAGRLRRNGVRLVYHNGTSSLDLVMSGANGFPVRTGAGTFSARSLAAPAAGFTITFPDGVGGNPTFALANDLAALEGIAVSGLAARTGADAWSARTITVVAGSAAALSVAFGDGAAGDPAFTVDAGLVSLAALPTAADRIAYSTAADVWAETPLTAYGRSLIDDVDAAAARSTLVAAGSAITLTAGAGLTGGGDLTANRTFAIGQGTGITVNADDVAVDQATAFAWTAAHSWTRSDGTAAAVLDVHTSLRQTSAVAANNIGLRNLFQIETDAGGAAQDAAAMVAAWAVAANATRTGTLLFQTVNSAAALATQFEVRGNTIGLYGVPPVARAAAYTQTYATADRTHATPTVGADIGAFTDPPSAAEMATLRTFVNALKADHADLAQLVNAIIDDIQAIGIAA